MAYAKSGSSSGANPPMLMGDQPITVTRSWLYNSSHARAVVVASTHFTDGQALGMKAGDQVFVGETNASNASSDVIRTSFHRVSAVASTYVTLSAGVLISSAS